jgi:hypothetical protein
MHKAVNIAQIEILAKFQMARLAQGKQHQSSMNGSASDVAMEEYA